MARMSAGVIPMHNLSYLITIVNIRESSDPQHLAKLRLAGLVRGRREGAYIYYVAADEHLRRLLADALFLRRGTGRGLTGDGGGHQLDFRTPGRYPAWASSRSRILDTPNARR